MQPITFTRVVDGESKTRMAHTPADAVRFQYDGWTEQPQVLPDAPVATEPGCQHADCVLTHPHAGPAVLAAPDADPAPPQTGVDTTPRIKPAKATK